MELEPGVPGPIGFDRDAMLPSLHLNCAEDHRRLGDHAEAARQVELGRSYCSALGDDGYGRLISGGLDRLAARLADAAGCCSLDSAGRVSVGRRGRTASPSTRQGEDRVSQAQSAATDRIWTIPNLLSMLRLAGVPLFLWLLLGPQADGWALVVLAVSAITDWADGKLARLLNQYSRLGELLDPAADRLYIFATLIAFVIRGFIPWWVAALLIGRDVILALALPVLRRHGYGPLPVHYLGKAATFCLLYAFPLLLLAQGTSTVARVALPIGYAFIVWGMLLYLWSGVLYIGQVIWVVRHTPVVAAARCPGRRLTCPFDG